MLQYYLKVPSQSSCVQQTVVCLTRYPLQCVTKSKHYLTDDRVNDKHIRKKNTLQKIDTKGRSKKTKPSPTGSVPSTYSQKQSLSISTYLHVLHKLDWLNHPNIPKLPRLRHIPLFYLQLFLHIKTNHIVYYWLGWVICTNHCLAETYDCCVDWTWTLSFSDLQEKECQWSTRQKKYFWNAYRSKTMITSSRWK